MKRGRETILIGELARRTGCGVEAIRYYERIGLLPPPRRSGGHYRVYGADDVGRLVVVRRAREFGFTLDQVRILLRLAARDEGACAELRGLAAGQLADIRVRIAELRAVEEALAGAVRRCCAGGSPACPVVEILSAEAGPNHRPAG